MSVGTLVVTGGVQFLMAYVPWGSLADIRHVVHPCLMVCVGLMILALACAPLHFGSVAETLRAIGNVRSSWLSREVFFAIFFFGASGTVTIFSLNDGGLPGLFGYLIPGFFAILLIVSMSMAYGPRSVPVLSTWHIPATLSVSSILLGTCVVAAILLLSPLAPVWVQEITLWLVGLVALVLLTLQLLIFSLWFRRMLSFAVVIVALREKPLSRILAVFWTRIISAAFGLVALTLASALGVRWLEPGVIITIAAVMVSEVMGRLFFYEVRMQEGVK